ncbi:MAG: hypothetical protein ACPG5T_03635, partial [Endozoicomonas sp.]
LEQVSSKFNYHLITTDYKPPEVKTSKPFHDYGIVSQSHLADLDNTITSLTKLKVKPDEIQRMKSTLKMLKIIKEPFMLGEDRFYINDMLQCTNFLDRKLRVMGGSEWLEGKLQTFYRSTIRNTNLALSAKDTDKIIKHVKEEGGYPLILELYAGSGHIAEYLRRKGGFPVFAVDNYSSNVMGLDTEKHRNNVYHADALKTIKRFGKIVNKMKTHINNLKPYVIIITPEGDDIYFKKLIKQAREFDLPVMLSGEALFHKHAKRAFQRKKEILGEIYKIAYFSNSDGDMLMKSMNPGTAEQPLKSLWLYY